MEPLVCAILLTRDRPEMAARAVRSFREQTYQNKRLYVYDTGKTPCTDALPDGYPDFNIVYHRGLPDEPVTIGMLRNRANWWGIRPSSTSEPDAEIIIHFDDDDYSHPHRIAEQVAFLQSSGADVVGYDELLFWRNLASGGWSEQSSGGWSGEAWLYSHNRVPNRHAPGTSFCYWRKTWERKQFNPQLPRRGGTGEDYAWLNEGGWCPELATMSSIPQTEVRWTEHPDTCDCGLCGPGQRRVVSGPWPGSPRLIASIHGGNTMPYGPEKYPDNWKRVPEWDAYCRERMAL